jgi:hypothetical protein
VALVTTLFGRSVEAQPTLRQECTALSRDDSAQVEARLLASLLTRSANDLEVSITCDRGIAIVSASSGSLETRRSVTLSGPVGLETIVASAERAISAVLASAPPETQAPAEASLPATPPLGAGTATAAGSAPDSPCAPSVAAVQAPKPVCPAPVADASARAALLPRARPTRADSNIRADASVETWGSRLAAGAVLGLEQSSGKWSYAVVAGTTRGLSAQPLFRLSEWNAAGELGWQPPSASGVRVSVRLGMSLLVVDPKTGVSATSSTVKLAAFAELDVSRPIWFGRLGLAPGLGLRAFSARRTVAVDGQEELQLATPSARALLTLLFRPGE